YVATIKALIWVFSPNLPQFFDSSETNGITLPGLGQDSIIVVLVLMLVFSLVFVCRRAQAIIIKQCCLTTVAKLAAIDRLDSFRLETLTVKTPIFFSQLSIAISALIFVGLFCIVITIIVPVFGIILMMGAIVSMIVFLKRRKRNNIRAQELNSLNQKVTRLRSKTNRLTNQEQHLNKNNSDFHSLLNHRLSKWKEEYEIVYGENLTIGFVIISLIFTAQIFTLPALDAWRLIFLAVGTKFTLGAARELAQSAAYILNERRDFASLAKSLAIQYKS
ncbi:hypothetical protein N8860_08065, partial [Alphaproteobacteria bacterium]|nr:hypothetical protein [Alphaproteobacteria bacterium]